MESADAHITTLTAAAYLIQLNVITSYIAQHSRKTEGQVMVNYESLLKMKMF
jgi:hypothetical protein